MNADNSARHADRHDPIRAFADRLRRLQVDSGGPSVRDLVRLTAKVGSPFTRATIQDKLAGRSAATWEFVEGFVRACALHASAAGEPDLRSWRQWHARMAREVAALRAGRQRVIKAEVCPYQGLEAFTADHAQWFHGRAGAVQDTLARLATHRAGVLLLGPSGAGKSSLLQAGVLPALTAGQLPGSDRWIVVLARPAKDMLAELDRAGLPGAGRGPITDAVANRLAERPAGARLLLVVDQFEELLVPATSDDQEAAQRAGIEGLAAAVGAPGLGLLLVLRDDFYPRLASQAPDLLHALIPGLLNVPATLNVQDLHEITVGPADAVGLRFQDGLPERIIADMLAAEPEATSARHAPTTLLPLLELTLEQLWQRRADGYLTHEAYQRIGGVAGAVTTWCDTAIEQLPPTQRPIAQRLLTALVRPADDNHHIPAVRQQLPIAALRELADAAEPSDADDLSEHAVDDVLAVLTDHRIVTTRTTGGAGQAGSDRRIPVAELVHEALIRDWATLRDWVDQDHRFQDWLHRAGERHARWLARREPGDLLHGSDLADGLGWSGRRRLPQHIAGFLAASRHNQRAGIRRARRLNTVLATLLVVALAAVGLAVWQRHTAATAQQIALSRQLAALSAAVAAADPELSSLLAVQAYRTSPTTEATGSLYTAAASPLLRRLTDRAQNRSPLAFSPDGRRLATAGENRTIVLWDTATWRTHASLAGLAGTVWSAQFSPDGQRLATVDDRALRLWDLATGTPRTILTRGHDTGYPVVFSPDGKSLAAAGNDAVHLFDVAGRRPTVALAGHTGTVSSLAFSPDGRTLATTGSDRTARLWDVRTGRTRRTLTGHTQTVQCAAFHPGGHTLATTGDDGTIRLWDVGSGRTRTTLTGRGGTHYCLVFSPDGRTVAATNLGGAALWDVTERRLRGTLPEVWNVLFSPDGRTMATLSSDGKARLRDATDGQIRTVLPHSSVYWMEFSPDGRLLATASQVSAAAQGVVSLWDAAGGQPRATLTGHSHAVNEVTFGPDGRTLATSSSDGTVRLWDTPGGQHRATLTDPADVFTSVAFSPDGRTLAIASSDSTLQLWSTTTGGSADAAVPATAMNAVVFSPDGRTVAGAGGPMAQLWDVASRQPSATLVGHNGEVTSVAFSPDGRTLATASDDHTALLWKPFDEKPAAIVHARTTLAGHTGWVNSVAFSPDGRLLATASNDHMARLWDLASGQTRTVLAGHSDSVNSVAFSPDGRVLATASNDHTVRLWDVAAGQTRAVLASHTDSVNSAAFSPDGRTLATAGDDRTVHLWDVAVPTQSEAIDKICRAVNRDLTTRERSMYLPAMRSPTPVCH